MLQINPSIKPITIAGTAAAIYFISSAIVMALAVDFVSDAQNAGPMKPTEIFAAENVSVAVPAKAETTSSGDEEPLKTPLLATPESENTEPTPESPAAKTPAAQPAEEETPAEESEAPKASKWAAKMQAAQAQQGTSAPFISDIPNVTAPFGDITSFSLGSTGPGSKWRIHPHLSLTGIFDDNIYLTASHKVSDFYLALSPGAGFSYGADESAFKLRGDYTASFLVFTGHSSQDTVDQNAVVRMSYALPKLSLGLNFGFQSLSGGSIDVGDRVRRQIYYVGATSNYVLDEKFSVDLNADETVANYHGYLDSNETRVQSWLNYQATGKIKLGIGALFGYLKVQDGPRQTYEELLGRIHYDATGKLALYASGGVDFRQSDTTNVSPVFNIGAAYSPTATTTITLDIHERIYGSASLIGQDYRATGILVTINQQLRPELSAFLSLGYEHASYFAVENGIAANRKDDYVFVRTGPEWRLKSWCHLGAFYEFSNNSSGGIGSRNFSRNRVGIQANFSF